MSKASLCIQSSEESRSCNVFVGFDSPVLVLVVDWSQSLSLAFVLLRMVILII